MTIQRSACRSNGVSPCPDAQWRWPGHGARNATRGGGGRGGRLVTRRGLRALHGPVEPAASRPGSCTGCERPAGLRWADVGCGSGALTSAILDSPPPPRSWPSTLEAQVATRPPGAIHDPRVSFGVGTAEQPAAPRSFDAVVSGLVLNFVPDPRRRGIGDGRAAPGGTVAAYVWDYAERDAAAADVLGRRLRAGPRRGRPRRGPAVPVRDADELVRAVEATRALGESQTTGDRRADRVRRTSTTSGRRSSADRARRRRTSRRSTSTPAKRLRAALARLAAPPTPTARSG